MKDELDILNNLKNNEGFSVPDDYFESLDKRINDRITAEKKPLLKKIHTVIKPYIALVAIFILALLIFSNLLNWFQKPISTSNSIENETVFYDFVNASVDENDIINFMLADESLENFETINNNTSDITIEDIESITF